jgi:pyruvate dehydrogenase E1 component beta subunit
VLLYNVKGETHDGDYCQSLERAEVVREGTDVSIFTYSRMRYVVMQAVAELEKRGYNPEVGRLDRGVRGVGWLLGGWVMETLEHV